MNTHLRSSLSAGLVKAGLVCGLLFVPIVTQGDATFFGSGGSSNTATNVSNVALGYDTLVFKTSGTFNTATGYAALYSDTTGYYNTANGSYALYSNTTGNNNTANGGFALLFNSSGSDNTALGYSALNQNTTGVTNTALGYLALYSNTTGGENTATGDNALYYNTTGYENVANGGYALYANTTGAANTALGSYTLYSNTTGSSNTALGFTALYNTTTGSFNTANGEQALYFNTTGAHNTATGYDALYYTTTGSHNTANGESAMRNNTAGDSNTAEGYYALYRNTSGRFNIALGYGAGQNINGSNNIDIGNNGATSESGVIRIGTTGTHNATYIAGINSATISSGTPVYINSNGQLGIVTSSRRFKHDIKDMGNVSDKLMQLRPVTFRYNDSVEKGPHSLQYGLIAEEVAKVYPNLVQYDKAGKPLTVYYHLLTPMLLNELQKEHQHYEAQKTEIASLKAALQQQSAQLTKLTALVEASQGKTPLQRTVTMQP